MPRGGFDTPKALAKALAKAADDVAELDAASAKLGALGVALARQLAPNDTGRLRSSVSFRVGKPTKSVQSQVRISAGGARAVYAPPIHWGWPARRIRKRPFVMDALARLESSGTVSDVYSEAVGEILRKALA